MGRCSSGNSDREPFFFSFLLSFFLSSGTEQLILGVYDVFDIVALSLSALELSGRLRKQHEERRRREAAKRNDEMFGLWRGRREGH